MSEARKDALKFMGTVAGIALAVTLAVRFDLDGLILVAVGLSFWLGVQVEQAVARASDSLGGEGK